MNITLELTKDQFDDLVEAVAGKISANKPQIGKPYSVIGFANATGLSTQTIYRRVEAGEIRRVKGMAKVLIPATELEKFA